MLANIEGPSGKVLIPPQENRIRIQVMHSGRREFCCKITVHGYTVVFNVV